MIDYEPEMVKYWGEHRRIMPLLALEREKITAMIRLRFTIALASRCKRNTLKVYLQVVRPLSLDSSACVSGHTGDATSGPKNPGVIMEFSVCTPVVYLLGSRSRGDAYPNIIAWMVRWKYICGQLNDTFAVTTNIQAVGTSNFSALQSSKL